MFNIIHDTFLGSEKIKLVNTVTGEYLSILPDWGANLNELVLIDKGVLYSIITGDRSIESIKGESGNFYRGAKLSPFPNRIATAEYTFQNQTYILDRNDGVHALHGLLWNLPFRVVHQELDTNFAAVELAYDYISNYIGYPFNYSISIVYRLESTHLICTTTLHNSGNELLPIGDGWHPYFSLNKSVDSLKLKLPASKQLEMDSCVPTGNYAEQNLFDGEMLLKDLVLDHCFELILHDGIVETELIDSDHKRKIVVWQQCEERGYLFIQVYIPPDRMSIAIEPMTCAPNAFNTKHGLIQLKPNETITLNFGIKLQSI